MTEEASATFDLVGTKKCPNLEERLQNTPLAPFRILQTIPIYDPALTSRNPPACAEYSVNGCSILSGTLWASHLLYHQSFSSLDAVHTTRCSFTENQLSSVVNQVSLEQQGSIIELGAVSGTRTPLLNERGSPSPDTFFWSNSIELSEYHYGHHTPLFCGRSPSRDHPTLWRLHR